jgi:hypothetical protein
MRNFIPPFNLGGNINVFPGLKMVLGLYLDLRLERNIAHCLTYNFTEPLFSERNLSQQQISDRNLTSPVVAA